MESDGEMEKKKKILSYTDRAPPWRRHCRGRIALEITTVLLLAFKPFKIETDNTQCVCDHGKKEATDILVFLINFYGRKSDEILISRSDIAGVQI